MNGEINGTMEEPMEMSPLETVDNLKKVTSDSDNAADHCQNSNHSKDSNHLDTQQDNEKDNEHENKHGDEHEKDHENEQDNGHENEHGIEQENYHVNEQEIDHVNEHEIDHVNEQEIDHANEQDNEHFEIELPEAEMNQDPLMEGHNRLSENESSNDSGDPLQETIEIMEEVPPEENFNSPMENHNINSNESYPESLTSSQAKSDTIDQEILILDESKDCDSEKDDINKGPDINEEHLAEVDSEDDSSDEDGSMGGPRAVDTLSINSDSGPDESEDDTSQESQSRNKSNDIIIVENDTTNSQNGDNHSSLEIHEVESDNDDCVVATEVKQDSIVKVDKPLRRSSRAIKRKKYNDEMENGGKDSDIEEVELVDPLVRKSKTIVINDTKTLVEMAAKQMRSSHNNSHKKEPTVVIIDTNTITSSKGTSTAHNKHTSFSTNTSISAQNLYQSIVARGTTVTPIKATSGHSSSQTPQPQILPSLTDDMFVVEAPSFIVPYVYEKPSLKPFREFVDILGKELEEQRAKEEKEEKEVKEKQDKVKQENKEVGETGSVEDTSKPAETEDIEEKRKKKSEKRDRQRHMNEDDDMSWDGESSSDSDDEIISDDEKTIIIKDKADSIEDIKDVTDLTVDKVCATKSDNYFDCSLGKFFINIGLNLVQEFVQNDLLKQQNRKLYREKKAGHSTKSTETSIASLMKNLEFSKENNAPFACKQTKCEFCSFKTESVLVMAHHLETPHMKNNVYKCNYCTFEIRSPHDILYHMEAEHNIRGRLERAPAYHQCANCPFEDNGKGKLARHLVPCAKKFKPDLNLSPPIEWEPPAKIPKITRARNNMMSNYQGALSRGTVTTLGRPSLSVGVMGGYRPRGRSTLAAPPRPTTLHGTPVIRGSVMLRHNSTPIMTNAYPNTNNGKPKSMHQPSISITPLPRQPQPVQPIPPQTSKSTFVICEICDGYIKDLEQLRNHMQWIHKVKIHPKMIYNRPPLNCQKCQFRFFTDQGLERHLLGSHGLVTSSMQEAANKGKDAGRCPVCGRVYQWKLLNHVARDHNMTLKPAHLSYKCTVCTATFGMYKQFENHVYSAHSVVAKRVIDKNKASPTTATKTNDSLLKPLKINDEITIIPQPVKTTATATKDK